MATLSPDNKYVTVVRGDTLSQIAATYRNYTGGATYQQLAQWNNISNPNRIYVGQKIYLSNSGSSSSSSSTASNTVVITGLGPLAIDDRKLVATWTWNKENQTEKYKIMWEYCLPGSQWFTGDNGDINVDQNYTDASRYSLYDIPENAVKVRFNIKPVSLKYKSGDTEKSHWEIAWSGWKEYIISDPLTAPSKPNIEIDAYNKLTASLNGLNTNIVKKVKFQIVQDDALKNNSPVPFVTSDELTIDDTGSVSYSYNNIPSGHKYKVRCQTINGTLTSEWGEFSDNSPSLPIAPASITKCLLSKYDTVEQKGTVQLEWEAVPSATSYAIEYTTEKSNFDIVDGDVTSKEIKGKNTGEIPPTSATLELAGGSTYYFRIRTTNEKGVSDWTDIKSISLGQAPSEPTTWSSATMIMADEPITLYWMHNSVDGSSQTYYDIKFTTFTKEIVNEDGTITRENESTVTYDFEHDKIYGLNSNGIYTVRELEEDEKDITSMFIIDKNTFSSDIKLEWSVATKGVVNLLSEFSTPRVIDIYKPATTNLYISDDYVIKEDGSVDVKFNTQASTITSFPFYVKAEVLSSSQAPIGYHIAITSNTMYETVDRAGNSVIVSVGDQIYSKYTNVSGADILITKFSADNLDLENGASYTLTCTASLNSGLTTQNSASFAVSWKDAVYLPNAEIAINNDIYSATIRPYCEERTYVYMMVNYESGSYTVSDIEITDMSVVDGVYTTTGELVHCGTTLYCISYMDSSGKALDEPVYYKVIESSGIYTRSSAIKKATAKPIYTKTGERVLLGTDGTDIFYYCECEKSNLVDDVTLAVYRREFDGSFTEIASGIDNTTNTYVTDPHPALDYARYRIVATTKLTGAISYYDLPSHPVSHKGIILQWAEAWSSFEGWNDDPLSQPAWSGSMIKLMYNVDVSDKTSPDVTTVKYVGRKHPVSYYGTHIGETASWNVVIPSNDAETIYALRRLQAWMGDVYVRSPYGIGYWANVKVSFSQKHKELSIPVTLNITRVEGGI